MKVCQFIRQPLTNLAKFVILMIAQRRAFGKPISLNIFKKRMEKALWQSSPLSARA
jgi:hypothetical protein